MAVDIEALAETASQELAERPEAPPPPPPRDQIFGCIFCLGRGVDKSRWAWLWGGNCWVCGGWGFLVKDPLVMRGPFAPRPGR